MLQTVWLDLATCRKGQGHLPNIVALRYMYSTHIYIYIYIYICICMYLVCIYIYMHIYIWGTKCKRLSPVIPRFCTNTWQPYHGFQSGFQTWRSSNDTNTSDSIWLWWAISLFLCSLPGSVWFVTTPESRECSHGRFEGLECKDPSTSEAPAEHLRWVAEGLQKPPKIRDLDFGTNETHTETSNKRMQ